MHALVQIPTFEECLPDCPRPIIDNSKHESLKRPYCDGNMDPRTCVLSKFYDPNFRVENRGEY